MSEAIRRISYLITGKLFESRPPEDTWGLLRLLTSEGVSFNVGDAISLGDRKKRE